MITFLSGTVVEKHPTRVVLDVGGVGYEVFIPLSSYDRLPKTGETCRILTVDYVREDNHQLFGFMSEGERRMFLLLMATNGIGPKLALSALSGLTVREIKAAIVEGDVRRLSSISGVGKKMAERIAVECRDKIDRGEAMEAAAGGAEATEQEVKTRDAVLALVSLGYKQAAARKMVADATRGADDLDVESIIKKSLSGSS
jgi:Holliday junction DNA helicase RuvA